MLSLNVNNNKRINFRADSYEFKKIYFLLAIIIQINERGIIKCDLCYQVKWNWQRLLLLKAR